jgi:hypothetical protein
VRDRRGCRPLTHSLEADRPCGARAAIAALGSRSARVALAITFYAAAAVVVSFPLVLHLADGLSPAPDTLLHSWILAWDVHALTTDPAHLYDANVYFPFPLSLTYSDAMLSGALTVAPVLILTGNPVLAHNLLTLVSLCLAGCGMYLLVRALTSSDAAALVAGSVFAFCAARQAHLEHVNLLQFGWLPLGLLCLRRAVNRGRTSDFVLFAVCTVCQALASVYLAWMMAIAYAIFIPTELTFRRSTWPVGNIARVGGALLFAALVIVPVMWPYELMQQIYGFNWPKDVIADLSAVPSDYLSVPAQNVLYAGLLARFAPSNFPSEHILFPGFTVLVLAAVAFARRSTHFELVRYGLIGSVAFVLSFGPFLRLNGQGETTQLPYFYLLQFVPGFGVMRVPARFDFLVMLALSVLAGFGVARLRTAVLGRFAPPMARALLLAVVALTLLEMLPRPQSVAQVDVGAAVPPVYGWLRTQDPAAVVAEIPALGATGFASFGYEYMSTYHWHPLVNGTSGFEPPAAKSIVDELDAFPSPASVEHLRSLGVRYLVAHLNALDSAATQRLHDADLTQLGLRVAATFGSDVVYEFAPLTTPSALPDYVRVEFPTVVGHTTTPSVTVTITNDQPHPLFVAAPESLLTQIEWNHAGRSAGVRQDLPVFIEPAQTIQLTVPAALPPGLNAADSALLTVRLTGSVQMEAAQTVQVDDPPTSIDRSTLSATVESARVPPSVQAGDVIPVEVRAKNTGRSIWLPDPPGTSGTRGVVGVSVRGWSSADGAVVAPSDDSTAHVPWDVSPGQAVVVTLHTRAPPVPGRYALVLDMLSESVTWFDDVQGGARTVVPIDVEP